MKGRMMKWLARSAFSVLVAVAMLMASPQYAAAGDCDLPEQMGLCPLRSITHIVSGSAYCGAITTVGRA